MNIKEISKLLNDSKTHLKERRRIKEKSEWESFNIFTAISNTHRKEDYCSDILKLILDPNTEKIGNSKYLKEFMLFIGMEEDEIEKYFPDLNKVEVVREENRIDILIKNKKFAIIIESKLNGAVDQPMQIPRYYNLLEKEEGLKVKKILYLTIIPDKEPDFTYNLKYMNRIGKNEDGTENENFIGKTEYYEILVPKVKQILVCKSATKTSSNDTLCTFLEKKCLKIAMNKETQNTLSQILIQQYSDLLKKLGGELEMLEPEKKLIEKIYSNKNNIQNAEDFAEVWGKRKKILVELFREKFASKSDESWKYVNENNDKTFYKDLITDKLKMYYEPASYYQIGFWSIIKNRKNAQPLLDLLKTLCPSNLIYDGEPHFAYYNKNGWIYVDFCYDNEPINEYFESIFSAIEKLEEKFDKIKKDLNI